jgi:CRP-like cAMP-binding protein
MTLNFRNFFLSALDTADIASLEPSLVEVVLARGDSVFEVGDAPDHIYFPSSAVLSVVTVMKDGRCVETATIGYESGVGLLDAAAGDDMRSRIFTQVAGSALRLPSAVLRGRLRESPRLMRLLLRHVRANAMQAELGAACNILHAIDARLAKWLLMTADRTGSSSFMLTQDYMAVMTGTQRSTISTTASVLKRDGLVAYTRGQVTILDRAGLTRRACECYAEAREQFDALRTPGDDEESAAHVSAGIR